MEIFLPVIFAVLGYYGSKRWGLKFNLAVLAFGVWILFGDTIKRACYPPVPFISLGEVLSHRDLNAQLQKEEEWIVKTLLRP